MRDSATPQRPIRPADDGHAPDPTALPAMSPSRLKRLLPQDPSARRLLPTVVVQSLGFGLLTAIGALYFTRQLGFSLAQLGVALLIAGGIGLCAGVPFGHLADRRGPRGLLIALLAGEGLAVAAYPFVHSWWSFVAALSLYQFMDRASSAVRGALIARLVPGEQQAVVRSHFRAISNIGFAVGASVAGIALHFDTPATYYALLAAAATGYLAAAATLLRCPAVEPVPKHRASAFGVVLADRRYLLFAVMNVVLTFHYAILEVAMPLWIAQHTAAPRYMVSVMFVLNTALVTLFQVRTGRSSDTLAGACRATLASGALLFACCVAFGASGTATATVAVVVLLCAGLLHAFGEMYQIAAAWTMAYELAPANAHGQYQGLFSTSISAGLMLGSTVVTLLVLPHGLAGWLGLGAMLWITAAASAYYAKSFGTAASRVLPSLPDGLS
jgi:MFS family permease